jgi:uncharacterized protein YcbX
VSPVKSLRLHHPEAVWVDRNGAAGDRRFLLVDDGHRLYNGHRDGSLVRAEARWDSRGRTLAVTTPDAGTLEGEVIRGSSTTVEVYGRQLRGHRVEGPWAGALSELCGRTLHLVELADGNWGTDLRPVTMISQSSLGLIDGDGRRFRMLIELDGPDALEEETWRNRRLHIGEATLLVGEATPRCGFPSIDPDTGRRDRDVLRELLDVRGSVRGYPSLGVYAEVLEAGAVRVGDTVEFASTNGSSQELVDRIRISRRRLSSVPQRILRG